MYIIMRSIVSKNVTITTSSLAACTPHKFKMWLSQLTNVAFGLIWQIRC